MNVDMNIQLIEKLDVAVVTASPDFNPLNKLVALGNCLKELRYSGDVVFDLLVTNGLSSNRFVTIRFNGSAFDRSSFQVTDQVDCYIKTVQDIYFHAHPDLLASSVLSTEEIKHF